MLRYGEFLRAKELMNNGMNQEALKIIKNLYYLEPNDKYLKFEYAKLLVEDKNTLLEGKKLLNELVKTGGTTRILSLFELGEIENKFDNPLKAKKLFNKIITSEGENKHSYLITYYYSLLELGKIELRFGNIDDAKKYFEKLINTECERQAMLELGNIELKFGNNDKARNIFKFLMTEKDDIYALASLIFLNIKEQNYIEAYDLFKNNIQKLTLYSEILEKMEFYLKFKLNLLTEEEINNHNSYFYTQLINYDEEKTIEHIKFHLDENSNKKEHAIYNKSLNINMLFDDIKTKITDLEPSSSHLVDKYIVEYDYVVGSVNQKKTNTIKVVTYSNTKDIITMYPVVRELEKDIIIINNNYKENDNINEKEKVKQIKRESQIDKFNKKYGLK